MCFLFLQLYIQNLPKLNTKTFFLSLLLLGSIYSYGQNISTIDSLEQLLASTNAQQTTVILQQIGESYSSNGQYKKAIPYYQKALNKSKIPAKIADLQRSLGVCHYYIYDYEIALDYYMEALNWYESNNKPIKMAQTLGNMAILYHAIKDFDKAIQFYDMSFQIYKKNKNMKGALTQLVNKGSVHQTQENHKAAILLFEKVLALTDTMPFNTSKSAALHNLAFYAYQNEAFPNALNYMLESLKIDRHHRRLNGVATSYHAIGKLYTKMQNYEQAENYLIKSKSLADSINAAKELLEISGSFAQLYAKSGQLEKEKEYLYYHIALKDSVYNIQQTAAIQELNTKYETEKQMQQIDALNKENALQKRLQYGYLAGFLLIILLLSLLLYSLWLRKKVWKQKAEQEKITSDLQILKNEKLQAEIAFKNRELTSLALHAYQKNELLAKIQQKLHKIKEKKPTIEISNAIDKVNRTLTANIHLDEEWNNFKLHFESVHPDFFNNLQNQFPKLTQVELKHCAYIKIGLTGKEIARLLNINNSSVHVAHYRIKKKLDLLPDISLQDYIQSSF